MMQSDNHGSEGQAATTASAAAIAEVDAWPGAAFVFDPRSASILAANGAGRALFPSVPLTLDAAMPAVRAIRGSVRGEAGAQSHLPLVFWTVQGITALTCRVEPVQAGGAEGLVLVRELTTHPEAGPVPSPLPDRTARSDDDTLRDIAAKIREGQVRFEAPSPKANADAVAGDGPEEGAASPPPAPEAPRGIDLAKLAHELKTPLSAIAAASEVMKEGRFGDIGNDRYAGYITDIHASARHALELIQRMLDRRSDEDMARGGALVLEKTALNGLVEGCLSTVGPLAASRSLSLSVQLADANPIVVADATALKQIVLNLLTNAMKFTPAGGTIMVETISLRRGARLTVADTGPGMTPLAMTEALRPVPLDVPKIRDGGGLGLGLPMSHALAEAMGASLSIDSAPGRGTRVQIDFPGGALVAV